MPTQSGQEVIDLRSDDDPQMAVGDRSWRNGVDWIAGVAGLERQYLKGVAAENPLFRREVGFPPVIDGWAVGIGADGEL